MPSVKVKEAKTKPSVKKSVKTVSAPVVKKPEVKAASPKNSSMSLALHTLDGATKGSIPLPKEIFGAAENKKLIAQAVRVYLVNQRQGTSSTKTRGNVQGSTRKIYRQKGTGRARHGAITAPIFVGGGTAFGPHPRNFELKMSKQMRRKALFSALSSKMGKDTIFAIDSSAATGKTKEFNLLFEKLAIANSKKPKKVLYVGSFSASVRAVRNIAGINVIPAANLNTYEVLNSNFIVFEKEAIAKMEEVFLKKSEANKA